MRVRLSRRVDPRDERGVTALIVVLALAAVFGMIVLVVDVGGLLALRRQMVTTADAAALAAAQECATNGATLAAAQAQADQLATANQADATGSIVAPLPVTCGTLSSGSVTVRYSAPKSLFFAPVIGGPASRPVSATATAIWGPVGSANPIPVTVDRATLAGCGIPASPPPPGGTVPCHLSYFKDTLKNPRWGTMDFSHWNDQFAAPCHVSADEVKSLIDNGGWPNPLSLNYPAPTYDCADNGLSDSVWLDMEGKTLTFPVVDLPTSLPDPAHNVIDTFNVIGFIQLYVTAVSKSGPDVFLDVTWAGSTFVGGEPGGGADFGLRGVRLCDQSIAGSCS